MILPTILYALPELALFCGIIHLVILRILDYDSAKQYARITRLWLLLSILCSIFVYDKSIFPLYLNNNAYTLLFNVFIGFITYTVLGVSAGYFSSINKIGGRFNIAILTALIVMRFLIASINLLMLFANFVLLIFINCYLLHIKKEKNSTDITNRFLFYSFVIIAIFAIGIVICGQMFGYNINYTMLADALGKADISYVPLIAISAIIIAFIYAIGLVPFHFLIEDIISKSILPVSHYFAVIAPIAYWGAFIRLNASVFMPFADYLYMPYLCFAFLSIIFGAIGANARINLLRIYAYSSMYHFALILLLFIFFNQNALFAAFIYLLMYILTLNVMYLIFYSLRSYNEYLSAVTAISGLAQTRPYTAGALLICLFSLIGLPPLAGFTGQFNLLYELINNNCYACLGFILFFLLVLAKSYLEIIKTTYFEQKIKFFDTENSAVILFTLIGIIGIGIIAFNPWNILHAIQDMFYAVFI